MGPLHPVSVEYGNERSNVAFKGSKSQSGKDRCPLIHITAGAENFGQIAEGLRFAIVNQMSEN